MGRTDFEIIAFTDDWHGLPFSCKHVLKYFLEDIDITWVETIGLRAPKITRYDMGRMFQKVSGWLAPNRSSTGENLPKRLKIVNPAQIPLHNIRLIHLCNSFIMKRALRGVLACRGSKKLVTITTWPFLGNVLGSLGEDLSIYMRVDDFSEFPGVNRKAILRLERELLERVDIVLATARDLEDVPIQGKDVRYLPHGVDYQHFSAPAALSFGSPVAALPRPRIGFFGLLSDWLDMKLIDELATRHPAWSLVFLGPSQLHQEALPRTPNFHSLGSIPYRDLPAHAAFFDVALIPFKVNKLTKAVNPLKLMEYLSLGLPVISTPLPEIMSYEGYVGIGDNAHEFGALIEATLVSDSPAARERRRALARENDWKGRAMLLRSWIEAAL